LKFKIANFITLGSILFILSTFPITAFSQYPPSKNLPLYDLTIRLDNQCYMLFGKAKITYYNSSDDPLTEILLQLPTNTLIHKDPRVNESIYDYSYPNGFNPGWMKILSVQNEKGGALEYKYQDDLNLPLGCSQKQTLLYIPLPNS